MSSPGDWTEPLEDERSVSDVLGYSLIFALVIGGIAVLVVLGGTSIADTQTQAEIERSEHTMTLFDSRAAMVALGESNVQTLSFGQDSGDFSINNSSGYINITHTNYSDSNDPTARTEIIYNETLGSVVYENGDQDLAYQGGGVWAKSADGAARMVSPPEFHYRGATLTLPVIRVNGSGSASGSVSMAIRPRQQARLVYPNETSATDDGPGAPYDLTSRDYRNPIRNGSVNVTVQSRYYRAWAEYFEKRTSGEVTVWDVNNTVQLELATIGGPPGDFEVPPAGDSVPANAMAEGHPIEDFDLTLNIEKKGPHYSLYSTNNGREFEVHIYADGNPTKGSFCPGTEPDIPVHVSVYYYEGDGTKKYEAWQMPTAVDPGTLPSSAMEWRCDGGDASLYVNLVSDDIDMEYNKISNGDSPSCGTSTGTTRGNKYAFNDHMEDCDGNGWDLKSTSTWDEHPTVSSPDESASPPPEFLPGGTTVELDAVTNHYLAQMGDDVELISKHGPGSSTPIDTSNSVGELSYETSPGAEFVTYLHVTENEIEVDFD